MTTTATLRDQAIRASVRAKQRETQRVQGLDEARRIEHVTIIRQLLWEKLDVAPERTRPVGGGFHVQVDGDLVFGYYSRWNGEHGLALVLGDCPRCGEMVWRPVHDLASVGLALEQGVGDFHRCHPLNVAEMKREQERVQAAPTAEGA